MLNLVVHKVTIGLEGVKPINECKNGWSYFAAPSIILHDLNTDSFDSLSFKPSQL